jgi:peroxin-12
MSLRPSYFEMVAAARLILGLKPALQYVLNFVGRFHPRLGLLGASTNEIFFALLYLIERHYLSNFDGSFSENFYGLKRCGEFNNNINSAPGCEE